jgi:hypothetical protein
MTFLLTLVIENSHNFQMACSLFFILQKDASLFTFSLHLFTLLVNFLEKVFKLKFRQKVSTWRKLTFFHFVIDTKVS